MWGRLKRVAEHTGLIMVTVVLLGFGFYQGTHQLAARLDLSVVIIQILLLNAAVAALSFPVFLVASLGIYGWRLRQDDDRTVSEGPAVTAIIPAYEETETLPRAVSSLRASTYDPLDILIACEPDDTETVQVARRLADRYDAVEVAVNDERPASKAASVNHAASQAETPLIGIFDADSTVHPEFVGAAVHRLQEHGADIAQARLLPDPTGWTESLAYYQKVVFSTITQQVMLLFHGFRLALSNGTVMTRDAFEQVDGYDPVLAEDFDFSFTCYRAGLTTEPVYSYPVTREAAHTVRDWWRQRKRWMIGYTQVVHRLLQDLGSFRSIRDVLSLILAPLSLFGSVFILLLFSKVLLLFLLGAELLYLAPITTVTGVALAVHTRDYLRGHTGAPHPSALAFPFVLPLIGVLTIKGVLSYLLTWQGEWYQTSRDPVHGAQATTRS